MVSKLKTNAKHLIRFGLFCLIGLLMAAGICYWQRASIAEWLAHRVLADSGIESASFSVDELDLRKLSISEIELEGKAWQFSGERLEVAYSIGDLWKNRALESLVFRNGRVIMDLDDLDKGESSEDIGFDFDQIWESYFPLPIDVGSIEGLVIVLESERINEKANLALSLKKGKSSQPEIEFRIMNDEFHFDLDCIIEGGNRTAQISTTIGVNNPISVLNRVYPSWKDEEWAETFSECVVGALGIELEATVGSLGVKKGSGLFMLAESSVSVDEMNISTNRVNGEFSIFDSQVIAVNGAGSLAVAQLNSITVGPGAFSYSLKGEDLREFTFEVNDAVSWSYDADTRGRAAISAQGRIADELEESEISFRLDTVDQYVSGYLIQPFEMEGKGTLKLIGGTASTIVAVEYPFIRVDDFKFTLTDAMEDLKTIDYFGLLDWDEALVSPYQLSPFQLSGWATVADEKVDWTGSLESLESKLVEREKSQVTGKASAIYKGAYNSESELIQNELDFSAASLRGNWDAIQFDGIALEGEFDVENLNTDKLSAAMEEGLIELIDYLGPLSESHASISGNEISVSNVGSAKWYSVELKTKKADASSDSNGLAFSLNSGMADVGPESIQQLSLVGGIDLREGDFEYEGILGGLLEGENFMGTVSGKLDPRGDSPSLEGSFDFEPFSFLSSDVASRHVSDLDGLSFTGEVDIGGSYWWNGDTGDASMRMTLESGKIAYPAQDLVVEGISVFVDFSSVRDLKSSGIQSVGANAVRFGDLEGKDLKSRFSFDGLEKVRLEEAEIGVYEGVVSLEPLEVSLLNLDADLRVRFDGLSVTPIMEKIDFFDGAVIGNVSGSLPVSLRSGSIEIGEGFLELVEGSYARLRYDASGLFDEKAPPKGFFAKLVQKTIDDLGLNPEKIVEDSLADLPIDRLRIDLFNRNLPGTPIRARVIGTADTGKVKAPLDITVNVNGTMEELLNFLLRMGSL